MLIFEIVRRVFMSYLSSATSHALFHLNENYFATSQARPLLEWVMALMHAVNAIKRRMDRTARASFRYKLGASFEAEWQAGSGRCSTLDSAEELISVTRFLKMEVTAKATKLPLRATSTRSMLQ